MRNELELIFSDDVAYADSRVIAKYFGKTPSHVTRDIKNMLAELDPDKSKEGFAYKTKTYINPRANGKAGTYFELDFDMTMTLITGYDVKLRHRIIQQWHRLLKERSETRAYARGIRHDFTYLAEAMLTEERGYHEVNPVCVEASEAVAQAFARRGRPMA